MEEIFMGIVALGAAFMVYQLCILAFGADKIRARRQWAKENAVMDSNLRQLHAKYDIMFLRDDYKVAS